MKVLITALFLTVFIVSAGFSQGTEWQQTNGPLGGEVQTLIEVGPDTLIAGTRLGGFFRSVDGGNNWEHIEESPQAPMLFNSIRDLVRNSTGDLFAATSQGIYRSTDKGETWIAFTSGLDRWFTEGLAINSADVIFAATRSGVYRSEDNGESWTAFNNGLTELNVQSIAITPLGDIVAGTTNGVFISNDNGDNWTEFSNGLMSKWIYSVFPVTEDTLLVGTTGGAFLSTDHGENWGQPEGIYGVVYTFGGYSDSIIYSGGTGFFFRSTNFGINWEPTSDEKVDQGYTNDFIATSENLTIATYTYGVLQSADSGHTWQQTNAGFIATDAREMLTLPNGDILSATNSGLYRTSNGGETWDWLFDSWFGTDVRAIAVSHSGRVFAGMGSILAISDDNADNLVQADTSLSESWPASIAIGNGDTVFVGFYGKIFRSINDGDSWEELDYEFPEKNIDAMIVATDGTVFAAANDSGIYRSYDGGDSWEQINDGLEINPDIIEFLFLPKGDLLAAGFHGVYHTDNMGDFWVKLGQVPTLGLKSLARDSKGYLYISSRGGGAAVSEDEGMTWHVINGGFWQKDAQGVYIDDMDNIYISSRGAGVFKTQYVSSVDKLTENVLPDEFILDQNFPNPFNPSTAIGYRLSAVSDIDLSIYNLLGQKIATLVSERQSAGRYQVEWDATGYASGVYYYRLSISSGFIQTKKLLLLR